MENKSIKINIPEGMEIDKEKSSFEEIVFKSKEKQLPKTWEELKYVNGYYISTESDTRLVTKKYTEKSNKNIFPTKELAEATLALAQLLQLRDVYNDGWIPDYENGSEVKYIIITCNNKLLSTNCKFTNAILAFKTQKLRNEFYDNFISLLETAKPLL